MLGIYNMYSKLGKVTCVKINIANHKGHLSIPVYGIGIILLYNNMHSSYAPHDDDDVVGDGLVFPTGYSHAKQRLLPQLYMIILINIAAN